MPIEREFVLQHFGDLWPVHNRGFTTILIECRKHFDGDLEQMLILSVIGDRALSTGRTSGLDYVKFVNGQRHSAAPKHINTQSVADSTGIPRETVRRKIRGLIERGWVRKDENGMLTVTKAAAEDLAPATDATFDYFIAFGNALLEKLPGAPATRRKTRIVEPG